jgi:NADH:ubiquinone oxidoreductase subunit 5 (subunit L)/multisubunit Na+/H+ antiporter MnhA subunit
MLSLAGIPLTAGFIGKFYMFSGALLQYKYIMVIIAVINAIISIFYYFRVIIAMYFRSADRSEVVIPAYYKFVLGFSALVTIAIGVYPALYQALFNLALKNFPFNICSFTDIANGKFLGIPAKFNRSGIHYKQWWLLPLLIVVFAETGLFFGFFFPGDYLLFLAGVLSAAGIIQVPIYVLVLSLIGAGILGNYAGYWFGYRTGPVLFNKKRFFVF